MTVVNLRKFKLIAVAFAIILGLVVSFMFSHFTQRAPQAQISTSGQQTSLESPGLNATTVSEVQVTAPDENASLKTLRSGLDQLNSQAKLLNSVQLDQAKTSMQNLGYAPLSGLKQDFSQAKIFQMGDVVIGRIQLTGSNLPALSSVMYRIGADGKIVTSEIAAGLISASQMHLAIWDNGTLTKNNLVTKDGTTGQTQITNASIHTVGLNWGKFNDCLNNLGINWAILAGIGIACAAACAATVGAGCLICLSGAAGFWGGSVEICFQRAWS